MSAHNRPHSMATPADTIDALRNRLVDVLDTWPDDHRLNDAYFAVSEAVRELDAAVARAELARQAMDREPPTPNHPRD